MSSTRTIARLALAVPLLTVSALTVTGCSLIDSVTSGFTDNVESRYYDYADFSENADLVFREAEWVPTDATTIGVRYYNEKPGNTLSFSSAEGVTAEECQPGELHGTPTLESSWWPATEPAEGIVCGDWQVFTTEGTWFAWMN